MTRPSAAPERIAPSRFWRSGTACQPTMMSSSTACSTASRSSGATERTSASAVPHESSTSPSPTAPAPTAALRWSWPPTASTAPRACGSASPAWPSGVPAKAGSGSSPGGAPDHASVSSHQPRECRSSQPVREASDSSAACSPPSRCTTHSATLSQRTPRSRLGHVVAQPAVLRDRPQRARASARCVPRKRRDLRRRSARASSSPRESCHAIEGTTGSPSRAEQHAGLGHARHAERRRRARRRARASAGASRRQRAVQERPRARSRRRSAPRSTRSAPGRARSPRRRG